MKPATVVIFIVVLLIFTGLVIASPLILAALETDLNPAGEAFELNLDPSDNLIITDYGANEIWQLNPVTNNYTVYHGALSAADAHVDSSGNIWWTDVDGNRLGRYDITNDMVTLWPFLDAQALLGLTIDDQDRVWLSDSFGPTLYRVDPTASEVCTYTFSSRSEYILYEDSHLWMSDFSGDYIIKLDPQTDQYSRWSLPDSASFPRGMAVDNQNQLWWADPGLDALASLDPASNLLTTYDLPLGSDPQMVATGPEGVWFTEEVSGTVGLLDPTTAVGVTTTLAMISLSLTPDCDELGVGNSFSSATSTGTASWTGVNLDLLLDSGGWQVYDLPVGGFPFGVAQLLDQAWVVDQGRQKLITFDLEPPTSTPTFTPTPSETPSPTPSETPSPTPSVTPSITPSVTPSITPSVTPSVTSTNTPIPNPDHNVYLPFVVK